MGALTNMLRLSMDWDLTSFLDNSKEQLQTWGGALIMIIGVVMIIVAIFQIAKKFISPQSAPGGWAGPIVCLIVGGALLAGGWTFVSNIAQGGKKTIEDLGSTIVPLIQNRFF